MGKSCLLLGAGLVSGPFITYISKNGHRLVVATRTLSKAEKLIAGLEGCTAVQFDIEAAGSEEALDKLVRETDCVVSLLPWTLHMKAAQVAMQHGKHFCTSSYVSDDMRKLDEEAKQKGIVMINECGVDPGLDHMSAQQLIDAIHEKGGKVMSFTSMCGGLPAPEANTNPFGYKLSWSPRGVLLATGKRDAKFYKDGKEVMIPGPEVFKQFDVVEVRGHGKFESYPNGDSTKYRSILNLPECESLVRGTYRNLGWCESLQQILDLGLLCMDPEAVAGMSFLEMTAKAIGCEANEAAVREAASKKLGVDTSATVDKIKWMGLLDAERKIPDGTPTKLDAVCILFMEKLQYAPKERDMLVMHHTLETVWADGEKETITSTMAAFGDPEGESAMARTVCLPLAIAVNMVLTGAFAEPGIQIPTTPKLYKPILAEMATLGVTFEEHGSKRL
eukprot:TRINITY_DN11813_c0_g1_i1.p1 TRINITY_DN11813_c0_g1~~TRINITY_DN11813_c0_g1_i1.p1  ORF type:complete len:447 (+),score=170.21 TRINITY_DN11813_c0_g1_i1:94-1434(+)